jgi:hypothetical protein
MIELKYRRDDIAHRTAEAAFYGTSFSPEKRGERIRQDYVNEITEVIEKYGKFATPENEAELTADLERYRVKYLELLKNYLYSHANVLSWAITGPSNFPVQRNEKRGRWADNHMNKLLEYRKKARERLDRKYDLRIIAHAPISADDDEAIDKLQAKIDQAEKLQKIMADCNKIIRSKKLSDDEKVAQVAATLGQPPEQVKAEIMNPDADYMGRVGFHRWQLSNNNANIRRMKQRIEQLQRERSKPESGPIKYDGLEIIENKDENRLQLIFDGKPSPEIRQWLKGRGFRWAPSQGAWQRQLNGNARAVVQMFIKEFYSN